MEVPASCASVQECLEVAEAVAYFVDVRDYDTDSNQA